MLYTAMAHDVTSEWDDIHRRLGNYEPLPVMKSQAEHSREAVERLEELAAREEEDAFEREFAQRRRAELSAGPRFGAVSEVGAEEYVREVSQAGEDVTVLLSLYESCVPDSLRVNAAFEQLCAEFPAVKFLRAVASRCVEGFPAAGLPCVLHYRAGQLLRTLGPRDFAALASFAAPCLRALFAEIGALPAPPREESARSFRDQLLGRARRPRRPREECDSDEEEREDRQFSSNRVHLRF